MSEVQRAAAMRKQMATYGAGAKRRSLGTSGKGKRRSNSRTSSQRAPNALEAEQKRLEEVVWLCYTLEDPVAIECGEAAGFPEEIGMHIGVFGVQIVSSPTLSLVDQWAWPKVLDFTAMAVSPDPDDMEVLEVTILEVGKFVFQCDDAFAIETACNDALKIAASKNGGLRPSPAPYRDRTGASGLAIIRTETELPAQPTKDYHSTGRSHVSDTALAWLKTVFRLADVYVEGVLETQHVRVLLQLLGLSGPQLDQLIINMDQGGTGAVPLQAFLSVMGTIVNPHAESLGMSHGHERFNFVDSVRVDVVQIGDALGQTSLDSGGRLSRAELSAMMVRLGETASSAGLDALWKRLPQSERGAVRWLDFLTALAGEAGRGSEHPLHTLLGLGTVEDAKQQTKRHRNTIIVHNAEAEEHKSAQVDIEARIAELQAKERAIGRQKEEHDTLERKRKQQQDLIDAPHRAPAGPVSLLRKKSTFVGAGAGAGDEHGKPFQKLRKKSTVGLGGGGSGGSEEGSKIPDWAKKGKSLKKKTGKGSKKSKSGVERSSKKGSSKKKSKKGSSVSRSHVLDSEAVAEFGGPLPEPDLSVRRPTKHYQSNELAVPPPSSRVRRKKSGVESSGADDAHAPKSFARRKKSSVAEGRGGDGGGGVPAPRPLRKKSTSAVEGGGYSAVVAVSKPKQHARRKKSALEPSSELERQQWQQQEQQGLQREAGLNKPPTKPRRKKGTVTAGESEFVPRAPLPSQEPSSVQPDDLYTGMLVEAVKAEDQEECEREEEEEEANCRGLDAKRVRKYCSYDLQDLLVGGWAAAERDQAMAGGSSDEHNEAGLPAQDCLIFCTPLDAEEYCEYRSAPSGCWQPSCYSQGVVRKFVNEQFSEFIDSVAKADCKAELRRRLAAGPPAWVKDKDGMPLAQEEDTHIDRLWFAESGQEFSARLVGSFEEGSRKHSKLWNKLSLAMTVPPPPQEGEVFYSSEDDDITPPMKSNSNKSEPMKPKPRRKKAEMDQHPLKRENKIAMLNDAATPPTSSTTKTTKARRKKSSVVERKSELNDSGVDDNEVSTPPTSSTTTKTKARRKKSSVVERKSELNDLGVDDNEVSTPPTSSTTTKTKARRKKSSVVERKSELNDLGVDDNEVSTPPASTTKTKARRKKPSMVESSSDAPPATPPLVQTEGGIDTSKPRRKKSSLVESRQKTKADKLGASPASNGKVRRKKPSSSMG